MCGCSDTVERLQPPRQSCQYSFNPARRMSLHKPYVDRVVAAERALAVESGVYLDDDDGSQRSLEGITCIFVSIFCSSVCIFD